MRELRDEHDWIPDDEWKMITEKMPIVSVDLIVLHKGGIILGKRKNEPAKGEWFVPGGRVRKGESLKDAVHRIAKEEIGTDVEIKEMLGAYEHFYDIADFNVSRKHYVAIAFIVTPINEKFIPDNQHTELKVFKSFKNDLHPYIKQYIADVSKKMQIKFEQ